METATLDQGTKILAFFRDVPREQVQALLASGLLADLRDANFGDPIDRDAVRRLFGLQSINPLLLEDLGTVIVPATIAPFVVREKFAIGNAGISWLGEQFKAWFIDKTEKPAAETMLRYSKLVKPSLDGPILAELSDKAETTLAQIWALMELQPNGEEGVLLTNGWANIFYVDGRVVHVYRDVDGWFVGADPVTDPRRWLDDFRVFSRDFRS